VGSGLSYPTFKAHAQYYIVISVPVWLYHIFLALSDKGTIFGKRNRT